MPIAIPIGAALIGAGGGIASSLINKKKSGSSSFLLPAGLDQNALLATLNEQKELSRFLTGEGKETLTRGKATLDKPLEFYQAILGGDRTKLMETLAPEIAAVNAQFRQPLAEAGITGRGGALAPDLEAGKQSAISNLFFKERPAAADKLTAIAQGLMNLGTGQISTGGSFLSDASHEILNYNSIIRGIQAQQANQSAGMWGSLGASLGPILAKVLKGSGGGNSSGSGATWGTFKLPPIGMSGEAEDHEARFDPALISSLINYGQQESKPDPYASWLETMGEGLRPR